MVSASDTQFSGHLMDFCETSHNRRQAPKVYVESKVFPKRMLIRAKIRLRAKTIVISLSRHIYFDNIYHNKVKSMCNNNI